LTHRRKHTSLAPVAGWSIDDKIVGELGPSDTEINVWILVTPNQSIAQNEARRISRTSDHSSFIVTPLVPVILLQHSN
jgi:hypothetical protein